MKNLIVILIAMAVFTSCANIETKKEETQTDDQFTETIQKPNTLTEKEIKEGWKLMFDGVTSAGWRGFNQEKFPEKGWEIVDGTIHVLGSGRGEAGGGGDIIFDTKYKNFELSLEWMVSEGGNSGIFYLAQEIPGEPVWKNAPEMQILDNERHPDARLGIDGNRAAGALYDMIPGDFDAVKPAGEWNEAKLLIYKGTVIHTMNGKNVVEYHLWTDDWKKMVENSKFKDYPLFYEPAEEGYIVLQDHGDDVWFRNIKIKEL